MEIYAKIINMLINTQKQTVLSASRKEFLKILTQFIH